MIRIILVEDNETVRHILGDMVVMEDDFDLAGTVGNGLDALELIKNGLEADILLADLNMKGMDGIELTEIVSKLYPDLKVIVLTMHAKAAFLKRALAAGARGYVLKNGDMEELYDAIRRVHDGELMVCGETNE